MKNEFNKPVRSYQGGAEYQETICFGYDKETNEFSNTTDLYVTEELIDFDFSGLTKEQEIEVQYFAEEIQQEMRNTAFEFQNMRRTEYSLYN